jgi:hypothetical protein
MDTSNLKAIFTAACCFVLALCSQLKSMDIASDLQEITTYKTKSATSEPCLGSLKTEKGSGSVAEQLLVNQGENKDAETSWGMYTSDMVKAVIKCTYNIANFPSMRTLTNSLFIAAQFAVIDAYCNCILYKANGPNCPTIFPSCLGSPMSMGVFPNETVCMDLAQAFSCGNPTLCYYGCFNVPYLFP